MNHFTHYGNGRSRESSGTHLSNDGCQGTGENLLFEISAPLDQGDRGLGAPSMSKQVLNNFGEVFDPHEKNQSANAGWDLVPGDKRFFFAGIFMSGDEGNRWAEIAMGHRYSCISGNGIPGSYPRNDLKPDTCRDQSFGFLTPSAENERVPSF